MREMKDSGVEWIGEIPKNKNMLRNKYMLEYTKGKLPNSTNTEKVGVPYIGASDLDTNNEYTTFTIDEDLPSAEYDDLLVLWDGARAGLCGTHKKGKVSSTIVRIRGNSTIFAPFLYWYYKGFEDFMYQLVNGTTIPHMNKKYIEQIGFIDWTISEQHRIADYLDVKCSKIDAIIETETKVIEKLKAYKLSVITEAVTKGLNPNVPMKDSGIEWIGDIPEHWSVINANQVITSTQNGMTRRDLDTSEGNIVLKLKNITANGELDYSDVNRIKLDEREIETYALENNDFLFVRVNGSKQLVGKCAIYKKFEKIVAYNDHIIRVRLSNSISKEFFYWFLQSDCGKNEINQYTLTAAGQFTINSTGLKSIKTTIPSYSEQQAIANYLDHKCTQIDEIIAKKQTTIEKLAAYKKSLIYEVVTGKKEV